MREMDIELTLIEDALATSPSNADIYRNYIASRAPRAASGDEEARAIESLGAGGSMTVWPRFEDGTPYLYDYQVKGYFKDACKALRKATGSRSSKLKAYKQEIDGLVFIEPRRIAIGMPEGATIGECQRPLRVSGPSGERVALACSETVPAGSTMRFHVRLLKDDLEPLVREWLDYGCLRGIGQWRNSGKGVFSWKMQESEES